MRDDKPAVSEELARGGKELAAAWADAEARAALNRVAQGMLLLALVLLLGAFLAPNPEVWYTLGPGQSVGTSGWYGPIPPMPPPTGAGTTVMNWWNWLMALLVTDIGGLCRFLSVASVVSKTSPVADALLYGALGAALLVWKSRVAAVLLLLLAAGGLVITGLRLTGVAAAGGGNVIVSILAVIGAIRGCQLAAAYHGRPGAGTA